MLWSKNRVCFFIVVLSPKTWAVLVCASVKVSPGAKKKEEKKGLQLSKSDLLWSGGVREYKTRSERENDTGGTRGKSCVLRPQQKG